MDRARLRNWIVILCRAILAAVFIVAAIGKIQRPEEFASAVVAFRILPMPLVNIAAITMPWIELLVGVAILFPAFVQSSALIMVAMNTAFITAALLAIARGLDIECGCFSLSHAHETVGWRLVVRDVVFLAMCAIVYVQTQPRREESTLGAAQLADVRGSISRNPK